MRIASGILLYGLATFVIAGCAGSTGIPVGTASSPQSVITLDEIQGGYHANTYDLIQSLRPAWLRPRGAQSIGEAARGAGVGRQVNVEPGQNQLLVYMERARLGGPESLRQIDPLTVGLITYLDRTQATFHFGPGHLHGAIVLSTR